MHALVLRSRCCFWYKSEDAVEMEMLLAVHVPRGCRMLDTRQRDGNRHVRLVSADRLRCLPTSTTSQVFIKSSYSHFLSVYMHVKLCLHLCTFSSVVFYIWSSNSGFSISYKTR